MRFEARELKPYAEPMAARDLREGEIYFSVNFFDDAMLIPDMRPLVFIGRDLESGDEGVVYFQDLDSYRRGIRYDSPGSDDEAVFEAGPDKETKHIFEYERALDVLMACSLRRQKTEGAS